MNQVHNSFMVSRSSPGMCLVCREPVTKENALRHLGGCLSEPVHKPGNKKPFILTIQSEDSKFWMLVLADHNATLYDLDEMICDVWGDCGDLMPFFSINTEIYYEDDDWGLDFDVRIQDRVIPGDKFTYGYEDIPNIKITLAITSMEYLANIKRPLQILARNNPPLAECIRCGRKAQVLRYPWNLKGDIEFFCSDCAISSRDGSDEMEFIPNSPWQGICDYVWSENILYWYPDGWTEDDLISIEKETLNPDLSVPKKGGESFGYTSEKWNSVFENPDDIDEKVSAAMDHIMEVMGEEIESFYSIEERNYGDTCSITSQEIVGGFLTLLTLFYDTDLINPDPEIIHSCLVNEMADNPIFTDDYLHGVIPVLIRFYQFLEINRKISGASDIIEVIRASEDEFKQNCTSQEKYEDIGERIIHRALMEGIDIDNEEQMQTHVIKYMMEMMGLEEEDLDVDQILKLVEEMDSSHKNQPVHFRSLSYQPLLGVRMQEISEKCREYTTQLVDENIQERCETLIITLGASDACPLKRGDLSLWAAALVYAACQDCGIIKRGGEKSPVPEDICSHFGTKLSSTRQKVSALRQYL